MILNHIPLDALSPNVKEGVRRLQGPGNRAQILSEYTAEEQDQILRALKMIYTRMTTLVRMRRISEATEDDT